MKRFLYPAVALLMIAAAFVWLCGAHADAQSPAKDPNPPPVQRQDATEQQERIQRFNQLIHEQEDKERRVESLVERQEKLMDKQEAAFERFQKILDTWERQQKQYQQYLDSLKK